MYFYDFFKQTAFLRTSYDFDQLIELFRKKKSFDLSLVIILTFFS